MAVEAGDLSKLDDDEDLTKLPPMPKQSTEAPGGAPAGAGADSGAIKELLEDVIKQLEKILDRL